MATIYDINMSTTYRNLCSWQPSFPQFEDGDVVDGGNLRYPEGMHTTPIDGGKKVRFTNMTLWNAPTTLPPENCLVVFGPLPEEMEEPELTEEEAIKLAAKEKFEEIKPLAYQAPLAVNEALNEVYTPEEINGVLSAKVGE